MFSMLRTNNWIMQVLLSLLVLLFGSGCLAKGRAWTSSDGTQVKTLTVANALTISYETKAVKAPESTPVTSETGYEFGASAKAADGVAKP